MTPSPFLIATPIALISGMADAPAWICVPVFAVAVGFVGWFNAGGMKQYGRRALWASGSDCFSAGYVVWPREVSRRMRENNGGPRVSGGSDTDLG